MSADRAPAPSSPSSPSTADLVNQATGQITALVRDEIALAKLEMGTKAKQAGVAGAMLGSSLILARCGLILAWILLLVALANVWPLWLAVAVPMLGAFALAGLLAGIGKRRLARAVPPVPAETSASVQTDLRLVQESAHEGRQPHRALDRKSR